MIMFHLHLLKSLMNRIVYINKVDMGLKRTATECNGLEWGDFLLLVDRLKKDKNYRFLMFVSIASYCGLRAGDVLGLKWAELVNKSVIEIYENKTGKSRKITLNQNLQEITKYCFENSSSVNARLDSFIFCNRRGNKISIQFLNRQLHAIFHKYKIKAQNPSSHTFRKTFGRRCYEMYGRSPEAIVLLSQIFSHSSISITRRYIGISQQQIEDVYVSL